MTDEENKNNNVDSGDENDEKYDPEAEVVGNFKALKNLPEVPLVTGEENDVVLS